MRHLLLVAFCALPACTTCREEPAEPRDEEEAAGEDRLGDERIIHAPEKRTPSHAELDMREPPPRSKRTPTSPDPEGGEFTVEEALAGLPGEGPVQAMLRTDLGRITCKLYTDRAPKAAANFIGLARGKRPFWDAWRQEWTKRPYYDGGSFHRVIPEFMIQGGCPYGDGSGDPGYEFPDEHWEGETHDKVGLLCMANRGENTNGSQFFVTDGTGEMLRNLDRLHSYTIFGECTAPEVVSRVARVPQRGRPTNRPLTPVRIDQVLVQRQNGSDRPPEPEGSEGQVGPIDPRREAPATPPGGLLPPRKMPPPEKRFLLPP